jgi:hypothetical protein
MYRIINNKSIFGISYIEDGKLQCGTQYRIYKNTNKYSIIFFKRSTVNRTEIFNIEFTDKQLENLHSEDIVISEIFVRCIYDRYIKEIENVQSKEFYYVDVFKCDI